MGTRSRDVGEREADMRSLGWWCLFLVAGASGCSAAAERERARAVEEAVSARSDADLARAEAATARAELAKARDELAATNEGLLFGPPGERKPAVLIGKPVAVTYTTGKGGSTVYPIRMFRAKGITVEAWLIKGGKKELLGWSAQSRGEWPPAEGPIEGHLIFALRPATDKGRLQACVGVGFVSNKFGGVHHFHGDVEMSAFGYDAESFHGSIPANQVQVIHTCASLEKTAKGGGKIRFTTLDEAVAQSGKRGEATYLVATATWKPSK
jgi:hypothetical protein